MIERRILDLVDVQDGVERTTVPNDGWDSLRHRWGGITLRASVGSFDTILHIYEIKDPALDHLATIVRGADTSRHDLSLQCGGLFAISLGLSANFSDDHEMLKHGMVIYEAALTRVPQSASRNAHWPLGSWGVKVSLKTKFSWGRARISCVLVTVACVTCTIMSASAQDAAMSIDIARTRFGSSASRIRLATIRRWQPRAVDGGP